MKDMIPIDRMYFFVCPWLYLLIGYLYTSYTYFAYHIISYHIPADVCMYDLTELCSCMYVHT